MVAVVVRRCVETLVVDIAFDMGCGPEGAFFWIAGDGSTGAFAEAQTRVTVPSKPIGVAPAVEAGEIAVIAAVTSVKEQEVLRVETTIGLAFNVQWLFLAQVEQAKAAGVDGCRVGKGVEPIGADPVQSIFIEVQFDPGGFRVVPRVLGDLCRCWRLRPSGGLLAIE